MNIEIKESSNHKAVVGIEFQRSDAGRSFASISCYSTGAQVDLFLVPEDLRHLRDMIQVYLDAQEAVTP